MYHHVCPLLLLVPHLLSSTYPSPGAGPGAGPDPGAGAGLGPGPGAGRPYGRPYRRPIHLRVTATIWTRQHVDL